jgi:hypothetical protein
VLLETQDGAAVHEDVELPESEYVQGPSVALDADSLTEIALERQGNSPALTREDSHKEGIPDVLELDDVLLSEWSEWRDRWRRSIDPKPRPKRKPNVKA